MRLTGGGCRSVTGVLIALKQSNREPNDDRRAVVGSARNVERAAADLRALAHHRHPEVTLRAGCRRVEPSAVVAELEHDLLIGFRDCDPDVGWVGVLERVHHALARDVEDQQRDRGRQLDLLHVVVEPDARVAADLVGERLE
jgi:hypothetical protein